MEVDNGEWLDIDIPEEDIFNPMDYIFNDGDINESIKRLMVVISDPEYFYFVCKYILNVELLPFQAVIISELWNKKFPMLIGSRGCSKSFCMSVYCLLRCLLIPKRKIIVVGAAFRQSKVIFGYIEDIWNNAPVLRSMCNSSSGLTKDPDKYVIKINNSTITCLPLGDGEKIRGFRAHDIIGEEFQSIPIDIFDRVVRGFGNVAQNPVEKVKAAKLKKMGKQNKDLFIEHTLSKENQIIYCGTAYYAHNHFAKIWKKHKAILDTKGDKRKLAEITKENNEDQKMNWEDYSIMRLPIDVLPEGLMDDGMISQLKATVHSGIYNMECGAVFINDSYGFFKRTLIDSCVISNTNKIILPSGEVMFEAALQGRKGATHVMGVDPAADKDNFSIIILEVNSDHRRIVHCWTTNRKKHREKLDAKLTKEADYYRYCSRKIRDLMALFPCYEIAIDSQGGGVAIEEALHDADKLEPGELPIWPCIEQDKEKPTDDKPGLHILRKCSFAKSDWLGEANHGMRKDLEDKVLLFPFFDPITLEMSYNQDQIDGRLYDNLEDCVLNIEDLKDELSSIIITQTPSGRERWDTPETKSDVGKKITGHKDRYSALLMANMSARTKQAKNPFDNYNAMGGFATPINNYNQFDAENNDYYDGPDWWTSAMEGFNY